jgi:hypothetical protein
MIIEPAKDQVNVKQWNEIISYLADECKLIHKWYSRVDGWGYLSYKQHRVRIDHTWTVAQVKDLVLTLLSGRYVSKYNGYH